MRVFFLDAFDTTSAYYRQYIINNALIQNGVQSVVSGAIANNLGLSDKKQIYATYANYLGLSNIVIAQGIAIRQEFEPILDTIEKLGKLLLIDIDDYYKEPLSDFVKGIYQKADGFICSTYKLADIYTKEFNKPCYVFENCIDFYDRRWDVKHYSKDNITIGYMGYETHYKDLEVLKDVIPEILGSYPEAEFQFLGFIPDYIQQSERVRLIPTDNDISVYPIHMAQFDIGLIPLEEYGTFNLCKSDLKFLEYSRLQIATIASQSVVYNSIQNKVNGLRVRQNKACDWIKAIGKLIDDDRLRYELSRNCFEYCKTRDIEQNIYKYIEILKKALYARTIKT
jgi:O-antigen biosynthesis protein